MPWRWPSSGRPSSSVQPSWGQQGPWTWSRGRTWSYQGRLRASRRRQLGPAGRVQLADGDTQGARQLTGAAVFLALPVLALVAVFLGAAFAGAFLVAAAFLGAAALAWTRSARVAGDGRGKDGHTVLGLAAVLALVAVFAAGFAAVVDALGLASLTGPEAPLGRSKTPLSEPLARAALK